MALPAKNELEIDAALARGTMPVRLSVRLWYLADYTDLVQAVYSRAGWKVSFISDGRDGDYLEFSL